MNKTKAYRRLKKKQKQTLFDWLEPSLMREKIIRLPLHDIKRVSLEELRVRSNSATESDMFGLRNFSALKAYIEVVDLEHGAKPELSQSNTSLPTITTKPRYLRGRNNKSQKENNYSINVNNGYTLLEAKLDALILPTPMKRKVSGSFSGSSSGFHGRKLAQLQRDGVTVKQTESKEKETSTKESSIQFPMASKMRQLLTIEQIETPAPQAAPPRDRVTANRAIATSGVDHRPSQMKEVNRAAKFYFPNYASQKQKTVAVPASNDSNMRPYKHCTVSKPSTSEPRLPKQVSFIDETNNSAFKQPSSPKHQTSVLETGISNRLVLTTKNLEMYNSVTMAADLSLPSSEDNRIVSWIKERQQWESEPWEDIPELDEEINSASLDENASQTTSSLGR